MRICDDEQKVCAKFRDGDGQFPNIERTIPSSLCLLYLSASWYTFECVLSLYSSLPLCLSVSLHLSFSFSFSPPLPLSLDELHERTRDRVRLKRKLCQTLPRRNQPLTTWNVLRACSSQVATKMRVPGVVNNAHAQTSLLLSFSFSFCLSLSLGLGDACEREKGTIR